MTFVNHRCTGGFTYFALHFIHATFCIEPRILAQDDLGNQKEFKISVKQNNADFLENKISLDRAIEILGSDAQSIIERSIAKIKKTFEDDYLVYFKPYKKTKALSLTMGWKFEFINKLGGKKCGIIDLTDQQKIDIYAGTNLNLDKKILA